MGGDNDNNETETEAEPEYANGEAVVGDTPPGEGINVPEPEPSK